MSKLDAALALAAQGFWVFPVKVNAKTPAISKWQVHATRDPARIAALFTQDFNIGIFTGKFGDDGALLVVDVDTKNGKDGRHALLELELQGFDLPDTATAQTPTGGFHHFFRVAAPLRQGADTLGKGLDTRSRGGYCVAAGSTIDGQAYVWLGDTPIAHAPQWLVDRCADRVRVRTESSAAAPVSVDATRALARARRYLAEDAPLATEGAAGDETTYKVACRLKDLGIESNDAVLLMNEHWNDRCSPPWDTNDLQQKVVNAYAYGQEPQGVASPEADFEPVAGIPVAEQNQQVGHPFDEMNKEYAFVVAGGGSHILWETTDAYGRWKLDHLATGTFHDKHAAKKIQFGKKLSPITKEWMEWPERRSYDGLVFMPQMQSPPRFYNLWRGFAVEPWPMDQEPTKEMTDALEKFLEHARDNVCRGEGALYQWLLGYFAHLVQRPWEKPLVSLVFRGAKGVGKNAIVERVGALLGGHFLLTSNRRYLIGNFNGHLENCLLFTLDEAFWSGDKQAEGTIKDLITGGTHVIEHKGKEPYTVDNRTRIAIIGNEDWLVPASHDERRFAVFDVGDGRKQDRAFFHSMRVGMEGGGYRLLLRHLLDYDLSTIDVNEAPSTSGLHDQKNASLNPFQSWWLSCLAEGRVTASDFGSEWPEQIECERFRNAYYRHATERKVSGWRPDDKAIGHELKKVCPIVAKGRVQAGYVYRFPPLDECRNAWSAFIQHEVKWEE